MAALDDQQQLLQNTQALVGKTLEAAGKALDFAAQALDKGPQEVAQNGPLAETFRLGLKALEEGVKAATVATDLSTQCIEIAEALEDLYSGKEAEDGSD